jgi:hypothetical protein
MGIFPLFAPAERGMQGGEFLRPKKGDTGGEFVGIEGDTDGEFVGIKGNNAVQRKT